jgi:DNA (cytosine-5)-methyltransferase 1
MSLGFEQAGFDVLAAVDHDPVHLAVHSYNFPHTEVVCADVGDVTAETVEAAARKAWSAFGRPGEWDGVLDCLFGGPSCQGFSYMGRSSSSDDRNDLIFEFARLVEELEPRTFVIENVPGLTSPRYQTTVARLYRRLKKAGYEMQAETPVRLDAADSGVPQWRRRVFIVGSRDLSIAIPTVITGPTVSDALNDLPEVDDFEHLRHSDCLWLSRSDQAVMFRMASAYAKSLRERYGYEYERVWDKSVLTGCQRTSHSPEVRKRFARLAPGAEDKPSRTRRLDASGKSRTLRAGTGRDHGSFTAPRPIHHRSNRVITIREAARLHSFPDWFEFHVTKWHGLREIGNAVPPRLAEVVAQQIVAGLDLTPEMPDVRLPASDDKLVEMSLQEAADYFGFAREMLPVDVRLMTGLRGSPKRT